MTLRFAVLATALLVSLGAHADEAASIKDKVPPEMLSQYCLSRGVGSENPVQLALPDGSVISGTIRCEAEDLLADGAMGQGTQDSSPDDVAPDEAGAASDPADRSAPLPGGSI